MFTQDSFSPVSSHGNSDSPKIWAYRSLDDIATISATGYFNKKFHQINTGEFVVIDSSDANILATFDKSGSNISLNTNVVGFNPATDINIERILDGVSATTPQEPTGLGVANSHQIDFGPAVNDGADSAMLSALGALTINESKLFRIKVALQFG